MFIRLCCRSVTLVRQRGADDSGSGEKVRQMRDGPGEVRGLQPDVLSVWQLHVLPLPRAHHRLQPLLPARPLPWRSLPPLPQVFPVDGPNGTLTQINKPNNVQICEYPA